MDSILKTINSTIKKNKNEGLTANVVRVGICALSVCFVIVTTKQFTGHTIVCAQIHGTRQGFSTNFIESFCMATYTKHQYDDEPYAFGIFDHDKIYYYQWIPFIVFAHVVLLYVPSYILAVGKTRIIKELMRIFYKLVCVISCILQIFWLNWIFGGVFLKPFVFEYGLFPVRVLCDVRELGMGNIRDWRIQCVLALNPLYERIFSFIFVLLLFIATVSSLDLIFTICKKIIKL